MHDGFWALSSDDLRWLLGFAAGLVGSYAIQRLIDRRKDDRLRRSIREVLVAELTDNLLVLDHMEESVAPWTNRTPGPKPWPAMRMRHTILDRCLDPEVSALLTEREQMQAAYALNHVAELGQRLAESFDAISRGGDPKTEATFLLRHVFPVVGQTLVTLLCNVLQEQGGFAASRSAEMATKLLTVLTRPGRRPARCWRSSDLPLARRPPSGSVIVWRNDNPDAVPSGVEAIVLKPSEGSYRTMNRVPPGWRSRPTDAWWRWRKRRQIRRAAELHETEAMRPTE